MNIIRTSIYQTVSRIRPVDGHEADDRMRVLDWVQSEAPLFRIRKPDVPPMHLVSYFVLYDPVCQMLLLVNHIKAGLWLPAGGHVEADELPRVTVEREIVEELGVEARFTTACGDEPLFMTVTETRGAGTHTDVSLWYVVTGDSRVELEYDRREFRGYGWFGIDEILTMDIGGLDPELHRFVRKFQAVLTSPAR